MLILHENLKEQGLLIPCNSPCNTPILGVKKSNDNWRIVLRYTPNPYTLLSEIPEYANYFSVIDLKDAL